jgi:hypothetical protein
MDRMKEDRESRFFVYIGHLGLMIPRKTIVESLNESSDLILISISPRKDYDGFAKVEV